MTDRDQELYEQGKQDAIENKPSLPPEQCSVLEIITYTNGYATGVAIKLNNRIKLNAEEFERVAGTAKVTSDREPVPVVMEST